MDFSEESLRGYIQQHKEKETTTNNEGLNKLILLEPEEQIKLINSGLWQRQVTSIFHRQAQRSFGICCFCGDSTQKDVLMWSHYADNHEGICFVLDAEKAFGNLLRKVTYVRKIQPYKWYEKRIENFRYVITKSWAWRYEDEYRLILPKKPNTKMQFEKDALVEIRFGLRIADYKRAGVVVATQQAKYANVKFTQMYRNPKEASLKAEPWFRRVYGRPF